MGVLIFILEDVEMSSLYGVLIASAVDSYITVCRFGHQDSVGSIDCLMKERPITAGMNDRTIRLWKVAEESQLVFHGHR